MFPKKVLFITGTNTEVGKTVVSYLLAKFLKKQGIKVGYWKPVETGVEKYPADGKLLSSLLGQPLEETVTYTYKLPLAPYVAAQYEEKEIDLTLLREKFNEHLNKYDFLIIEGAGGLAVPILKNYTYGNLAKEWNLPTLIVGRARLGTINDCFLTAYYGKSLGINLVGFVLNGFTGKDLSEKDNPRVVEEMTQLPVLVKIPQSSQPLDLEVDFSPLLGKV